MKKKVILLIILVMVVLFAILISPLMNISFKNESISKAQWKEDLEYMRKNLPKKHTNLFFKTTRQEFDNSIINLEQDLNNIDSQEIQVRLMSIISSIGDAHTNIVNFDSKYKYPLNAYWFKEGLFVVGTSSKYKDILGCQITEINGIPIDKIIEDINTLIPHENEFLLKSENPSMLQEPKVLRHFGVINEVSEKQNIILTLVNQDNMIFKTNILPEVNNDIKWSYLTDKIKSKSLYLSSNENSCLKYSEDGNLIYYRFNTTANHPNIKELSLLKSMLKEKKAKKLIIDIRDNVGGSYFGNSRLVNIIRNSSYFNSKGKLFVIVGRKTFSSGIQYTYEFKNRTNAIFYGEPTGGKPNHYGELHYLKLPNSKISLSYSTKYFQCGSGDTFFPDCSVEYSIKDFLAGIDPAVEKIKSDYR